MKVDATLFNNFLIVERNAMQKRIPKYFFRNEWSVKLALTLKGVIKFESWTEPGTVLRVKSGRRVKEKNKVHILPWERSKEWCENVSICIIEQRVWFSQSPSLPCFILRDHSLLNFRPRLGFTTIFIRFLNKLRGRQKEREREKLFILCHATVKRNEY